MSKNTGRLSIDLPIDENDLPFFETTEQAETALQQALTVVTAAATFMKRNFSVKMEGSVEEKKAAMKRDPQRQGVACAELAVRPNKRTS